MKYLDRIEEILIAVLMATATALIFVAVVHRYLAASDTLGDILPGFRDWLIGVNLSWAQELCIYLFVWMAKFGAAYGVRTGIHAGVDILINNLKPRLRARFVLFGLASGALFTGVVAWLGATFVWRLAGTEQTSSDLEVPIWIVYLAIPLGSSLMCFRFLQVGYGFIRTGELPTHDHSHVDGVEETPAR